MGLLLPLDVWRPRADVREPNPILRYVQPRQGGGGERRNGTRRSGTAEKACHIAPELRMTMPLAVQRRMCQRAASGASRL